MALDDADKQTIAGLITAALKTNNDELGTRFVTAEAAGSIVTQAVEKMKLGDMVKTAVTEATKGLPKPGEGGGKKEGEGEGGKVSPEVAALNARLLEMENKNKEAETARQAAESRDRENRLEAMAKDALAKAGIPADRHAHAMPFLKALRTEDGKPVLGYDDAGNPKFLVQKTGYVEAVSVEQGLTAWAKSDAAKVYLPATGRQGTGEGGGAGNAGGTGGGGSAPRNADGTVNWTALGSKANVGNAIGQTS
jgi:hypothetical protein